jgi:superfamily II DNA or RNA helicase
MRSLREDQTDALNSLRQAMCEGIRHVIMQAPTGFGKTVLSAELVRSARAKNRKVLFTVPAISLVDQTVESFIKHSIPEDDIGVMQADHWRGHEGKPVTIASVQTLQKREMPDVDVVLIDEVHRWFDCYGAKWLRNPDVWLHKPVIGLSATPWRKPLGEYFKRLIRATTIQELIDKGHLSDFKVFSPSHPELSDIKTVAGDYDEGKLSERMQDNELVADVVETWLEHGRGRPTLCFAVDCAHAKKLQLQFQERGVRCAYQDAFTNDADRFAIKHGFHDGSIEVVVNVGTLTTGVDWDVRCISMVRPTKSEILFTQIMGRGLRTAPGKDHLLVLDHSTNHIRLGFVTDIDAQHEALPEGSEVASRVTERIRLPKECPQCNFMKAPGVSKCPVCAFVAIKHSKVEPTAGELKELERQKKAAKESFDRDLFYAELLGHAERKGWKPGWAANQYREKLGVWPARKVPAVHTMSGVTSGWIKHQRIAWAKSKRR